MHPDAGWPQSRHLQHPRCSLEMQEAECLVTELCGAQVTSIKTHPGRQGGAFKQDRTGRRTRPPNRSAVMWSSLSGYLLKKRYSSNRLCTMHAYSWRSRGAPPLYAAMRASSASDVRLPWYTCARGGFHEIRYYCALFFTHPCSRAHQQQRPASTGCLGNTNGTQSVQKVMKANPHALFLYVRGEYIPEAVLPMGLNTVTMSLAVTSSYVMISCKLLRMAPEGTYS